MAIPTQAEIDTAVPTDLTAAGDQRTLNTILSWFRYQSEVTDATEADLLSTASAINTQVTTDGHDGKFSRITDTGATQNDIVMWNATEAAWVEGSLVRYVPV